MLWTKTYIQAVQSGFQLWRVYAHLWCWNCSESAVYFVFIFLQSLKHFDNVISTCYENYCRGVWASFGHLWYRYSRTVSQLSQTCICTPLMLELFRECCIFCFHIFISAIFVLDFELFRQSSILCFSLYFFDLSIRFWTELFRQCDHKI
jgi:hypothetical protein